jgi:hypothetical protein
VADLAVFAVQLPDRLLRPGEEQFYDGVVIHRGIPPLCPSTIYYGFFGKYYTLRQIF